LNILHVNASDIRGGAARAAYRIHRALLDHDSANGLQSEMRVISKHTDDHTVIGGWPESKLSFVDRLDRKIGGRFRSPKGFISANPVLFSTAWPSTGLGKELKQLREQGLIDIVHLHWLGDQTLSIEEIGRLRMPLVWTLHDQWPFCGAEHYTTPPPCNQPESNDKRFVCGYNETSRPEHESGPDLNRITWLRKRCSWQRAIHIVCPSYWLAECTRRSALMANWPITVIPNPIDLSVWRPFDQEQARALFGLPAGRPIVLFGALGGTSETRKGADLLLHTLKYLRSQLVGTSLEELELVVFGQSRPLLPPNLGFPIHYIGRLHDDLSLRLLYASADVFVIPSRQDNLPNTGLEAHACGTPVVAFRIGGLVDIVDHHITGALADPFDPLSLAEAIRWVLDDSERRRQLGLAARQKAEQLWNFQRVAGLYAKVYQQALQ
jgi:glycosyltransferase involved in cell wall biosynthesis